MSTVDIFTGSMKMKTLDLCWAGLIQFNEFAVPIKSGQKKTGSTIIRLFFFFFKWII